MKFAWISAEKAYRVATMCRVLGVSTSGYYAWRRRPPSQRARENARLRVRVREAFVRSRQTYGSPRIHADLADGGDRVGRNRVIRLMTEQGLVARVRRRYRSTTMSDHDQPVAANLLNREFEATQPNQRWVGDTTELTTPTGKFYLAAIIDPRVGRQPIGSSSRSGRLTGAAPCGSRRGPQRRSRWPSAARARPDSAWRRGRSAR